MSDLRLVVNGKLNYASLILLARKETIQTNLPQCKIIWEFRNNEVQIHFDERETIEEPLFIAIDRIWQLINQPTLNKRYPIQLGAYIFDLSAFNEEVIREAILNAIAHRDYTITSEVVVKQYPNKIIINNPGGFPKGVTIENILTVSSTPRSRLMTEILEETGLVERSGQGVDKIFSITLSEGKTQPDYKNSDKFQVSLVLQADIIDKAFYIFINRYQNDNEESRLGVEQIITLCKIRDNISLQLKPAIVLQLEEMGLVKKVSSHTSRYTLSEEYHQLVSEGLKIGTRYIIKEIEQILSALHGSAKKIGDLEKQLTASFSRSQMKYILTKLKEDDVLKVEGNGKGTRYFISEKFADLRGGALVKAITSELRNKYDEGNSL